MIRNEYEIYLSGRGPFSPLSCPEKQSFSNLFLGRKVQSVFKEMIFQLK